MIAKAHVCFIFTHMGYAVCQIVRCIHIAG